ncbi:hypothetical protein FEP07_00491 [Burkholderia multivorans]|nr:hypothetical protein [Burkholderia multivorans]MDR9265851.1 hypothetical protein [Burkholderia multivorans]MDR9282878.1 hypothetical protein [Burkholderia multivorans]MDR9288939.1 hypothetical protein [Burkholderia multivorans]MDR9313238.1 hypothetical protein [Burkholderia multivorans]
MIAIVQREPGAHADAVRAPASETDCMAQPIALRAARFIERTARVGDVDRRRAYPAVAARPSPPEHNTPNAAIVAHAPDAPRRRPPAPGASQRRAASVAAMAGVQAAAGGPARRSAAPATGVNGNRFGSARTRRVVRCDARGRAQRVAFPASRGRYGVVTAGPRAARVGREQRPDAGTIVRRYERLAQRRRDSGNNRRQSATPVVGKSSICHRLTRMVIDNQISVAKGPFWRGTRRRNRMIRCLAFGNKTILERGVNSGANERGRPSRKRVGCRPVQHRARLSCTTRRKCGRRSRLPTCLPDGTSHQSRNIVTQEVTRSLRVR